MSGLHRGRWSTFDKSSLPAIFVLYSSPMRIHRRKFLESLGAIALVPVGTGASEGSDMWGMIGKMRILPGKRDEMIGILKASAASMPGCFSYVVAKDATDENMLWVTEVWDSQASHDASLSLPAVKQAIPHGQALVANFERVAVTTPVWGAGLSRAH